MKELVKTLVAEFNDKDYAHAYMEEFSNMAIAAQIKALREQHGWTQEQLAKAASMKQERICMLEDVDYDAWTIKTLRKLARAFDLTLRISFEKFSDSILDVTKINTESLKRTPRERDLNEFSCNGFKYEATLGKTVITGPTVKLISISANDRDYAGEGVCLTGRNTNLSLRNEACFLPPSFGTQALPLLSGKVA